MRRGSNMLVCGGGLRLFMTCDLTTKRYVEREVWLVVVKFIILSICMRQNRNQ